MSNIRVSICCLTYNHEKYIRQALDSFLAQETNFDYEILVHDDCSTDSTPKILKEYQKKYPDKVKPIFQKENQFSKGVDVFKFFYPEIKGDYVAECECDDFWSDKHKLQKQFDVLENNPDCDSCVHIVSTCKEDGSFNKQVKPSKKYGLNKDMILTNDDLAKLLFVQASGKCPFQTSCFFYRKKVIEDSVCKNWSIERRINYDINRSKSFLLFGNTYYINESLSTYRVDSDSSLSNASKKDPSLRTGEMNNLLLEDIKFDKYTNGKYHEYLMIEIYKYLLYAKENDINVKENKEISKEYGFNSLDMYRYLGIKRTILHIFRNTKLLSKYVEMKESKDNQD